MTFQDMLWFICIFFPNLCKLWGIQKEEKSPASGENQTQDLKKFAPRHVRNRCATTAAFLVHSYFKVSLQNEILKIFRHQIPICQLIIEIPPGFEDATKFRGTLGHKVNHSFMPNSEYHIIDSPRFVV